MKQKEQVLITYLADMSQCLQSHDDWWSEKFKEDSIQAQNLFNLDAELKDSTSSSGASSLITKAEWEGCTKLFLKNVATEKQFYLIPSMICFGSIGERWGENGMTIQTSTLFLMASR